MIAVPQYVDRPAECSDLEEVETEGASALQVMERQHAAILAYEARIKACAR